jgi:hypothetical protein
LATLPGLGEVTAAGLPSMQGRWPVLGDPVMSLVGKATNTQVL